MKVPLHIREELVPDQARRGFGDQQIKKLDNAKAKKVGQLHLHKLNTDPTTHAHHHQDIVQSHHKITMKLSLLISALATTSVNAFSWRWSSRYATCSGDPFTNVALAVRCTTASGKYTRSDPSHCGLGDTAHAKGSLLATNLFSNGQVEVTPSVAGLDLVWDKKVYGHLSDWLTALDGQQFGEPGRYTIR